MKVKSVETKSSIHDDGEMEGGGSGKFTLNWVRALVFELQSAPEEEFRPVWGESLKEERMT